MRRQLTNVQEGGGVTISFVTTYGRSAPVPRNRAVNRPGVGPGSSGQSGQIDRLRSARVEVPNHTIFIGGPARHPRRVTADQDAKETPSLTECALPILGAGEGQCVFARSLSRSDADQAPLARTCALARSNSSSFRAPAERSTTNRSSPDKTGAGSSDGASR